MQSFEVGTLAGAGSFRCDECGFAVALREDDAVPPCPHCDGRVFHRALMFADTGELPAPHVALDTPDWLGEAREALVSAGHYLAYEAWGRVRVMRLPDGWTRIGRSLSAQLRLDDPTVSRRHALVYRDDEGARVLDDRSLNGVFKNGERVDLAELGDGDSLAVGRFTLHFIGLSDDRASAEAETATA